MVLQERPREGSIQEPGFVPDNLEPRCPVVLLLDNSGSMSGEPIKQLNQGLVTFKEELNKDSLARMRVEVAIVSFGDQVNVVQDFITVDDFIPPTLQASGLTPMGTAINVALDLLEDRKETYRANKTYGDKGLPYFRPWVFLITDGQPEGEPDGIWQDAAQRVRQGDGGSQAKELYQKKFSFFAVGVEQANMNILRQITPAHRPPLHLNGLNFRDMFVWLSNSMGGVSHSQIGSNAEVPLPPIGGWATVST